MKELPDADNTLIIYIVGDNGASAEGGMDGTINEIKGLNGIPTTIEEILPHLDKLGGPETEPHYPVGWAWAGNTPFQWVKQVASHLGGTRSPMVVTWPAKIKTDAKPRDAFLHLIDVLPTILEAANIPMPDTVNGIKQKPLAGKSFLASFNNPEFKGRSEQYFEVFTNRSMYADGWKANAQHTLPRRQDLAPGNWDKDEWELYNLVEDFSEADNIAAKNPEKLAELKAKFDEAAEKYHIYPFNDRGAARIAVPKPPVPGAATDAKTYTYYPSATRIAEPAAPPMKNKSWTLTAKIRTEGEKTEGVIVGFGGVAAGLTLYLKNGVPIFDYNYFEKHTVLKGDTALPAGEAVVELDFEYKGGKGEMGKGANLAIKVNGKAVAEGTMKDTVPARFGIDTFGIGEDSGQPITFDYKAPFKFSGVIYQVSVAIR